MQDARQIALDEAMAGVMGADNISEASIVVDRYPRIGRTLTKFEDDLRDWGLICGIAFGLAKAANPDEPNGVVADLAYKVARARFKRWAGEIDDPDQARDKVLQEVVAAFTKEQERSWREHCQPYKEELTGDLRDALYELEVVLGVTA